MSTKGKERGPNILMISTDQQHAWTMSRLGNRDLATPALDGLMERGTTLTKNYCTYPLCSPARASMYTGRMPSEAGVHENGLGIREDIPNVGQWFTSQTDYETLYAGKWHVAVPHTVDIPGFRVINTGINCEGAASDYSVSMACEAYLRNRSREKPFLLAVNFTQPHDIGRWVSYHSDDPGRIRYPAIMEELPELPANFEVTFEEPALMRERRLGKVPCRKEWGELQWRFYRWAYYRMVEMVDAEIGRVLKALDESGEGEDTLVIFTSDHGEGLGHHQSITKGFLHDEASRVPLIVSWPGVLPQGRVDDESLVSGLDLVPTMCDYAGIAIPEKMTGVSLRGVLERGEQPNRACIGVEAYGGRGQMIRTPRYKYITLKDDPVELLFDMDKDPGETRNLATEEAHAKVLKEHRELLLTWNRGLDIAETVPAKCRWV